MNVARLKDLDEGLSSAPRAPVSSAPDGAARAAASLAADIHRPLPYPMRPSAVFAPRVLRAGAAALAFAAVSLLTRAAVRVYFARLQVQHRERFPARGPVLLVANHPAMWTDVLVLDVALGRKLHFLAQGTLFRPRLRAAILRLHGALPVHATPHGAGAHALNADTFEHCRQLFERGAVVAMFPEGVSATDRSVLQLKTGAARLALEAARIGALRAVPVVLPAGIHYANRTAYGSTVTVSVGEPIALAGYTAWARQDPEAAVHALTGELHTALRALILDLPGPTLARAVRELEPLAALSARTGTLELASAQRIAGQLAELEAHDPARFAQIERHTRAYARARRALGLSDRTLLRPLAERASGWRTFARVTTVVLGAIPGATGALLHALPWVAGESIAHRVGRDPVRFSFARIACGIVFFPVLYAVLLVAASSRWPLDAAGMAGLLALAVALGLWTLAWASLVRDLVGQLRRAVLARTHPRLLRRALRAQRALLDAIGRGPDSRG